MVEGLARFVEDQVLELGRVSRRFDDATVKSIDAAVQVESRGRLIPMENLVDGNHLDFMALGGEPDIMVQLRYTLKRMMLTERHVFYEQAGSLVFYLMNRRGDDGRALLISYLRDFYTHKSKPEGWKRLGWSSAAELEDDFRAFLRDVGRRG